MKKEELRDLQEQYDEGEFSCEEPSCMNFTLSVEDAYLDVVKQKWDRSFRAIEEARIKVKECIRKLRRLKRLCRRARGRLKELKELVIHGQQEMGSASGE